MTHTIIACGRCLLLAMVIAILPPFRQVIPGINNNAFRKIYPKKWSFLFRIPAGEVKKDGIALPLFVEQLVWYVVAIGTAVAAVLLLLNFAEILWLAPVVCAGVLILEIVEMAISTAVLKHKQKTNAFF